MEEAVNETGVKQAVKIAREQARQLFGYMVLQHLLPEEVEFDDTLTL